MITTAFPFASGESYLETELPYLLERFDKILLFTIGLNPGVSPIVALPENVLVCNPSRSSAKKAKLFDMIKGLPCLFHFPKKFESEKTDAGYSPLKRAFAGYLISRSRRHCKEIEKCMGDFDFSCFDEVVLYGYWLFAAATTAVLLKEKLYKKGAKKVSAFSRAHSYDVYEYANKLGYLPLRLFLGRNLDKVFACSQDGKKSIIMKHPSCESKTEVSYLGTENGMLTKGSEDGVFRILTCSRTIPLKRLDRLVDALSLLKEKNIPLSWTHIGDGPSLDGIKKAAREKLTFMTVDFKGEMAHDDVIEYIRTNRFDLFVNISKREGAPVSVMEAVSFGIPSVVTDVGGCKEIITHGENGFVIDPDFTDEQLAQLIADCATSINLAGMREKAYLSWKNNFNASQNYSDFAKFISGE